MKKIFGSLFFLLLFFGTLIFLAIGTPQNDGIVLAAPGEIARTFLNDQAGISAWFQFSEPVNLQSNLLRNKFRYIEAEGATYILGPLMFDSNTDNDVMAFVHSSGWAVAYLLRNEPTIRMYTNPTQSTTSLEQALSILAQPLGVVNYQTYYYHYLYPDANRITVVGKKKDGSGITTFTITPTSTYTYYERSWMVNATSGEILNLDGINLFDGVGIHYGRIETSQFVNDAPHVFTVNNKVFGTVYAGIAIVYRQP